MGDNNGGKVAAASTEDIRNQRLSVVHGKEIRNVVVLSLSFLCLFSSYMAIQNLQGSLNDEGGLGVLSLSCLYGTSILSCIFAPVITTVLGVKRAVLVAFATHLVYNACNFYPSFATLIPSSILLGSMTGPLWSSQGIIMTTSAFSYAERTGTSLYASLSKMNGIYYTLYNLNNIIGNLVSSLVLVQGNYNTTNNNTDLCGVNDCGYNENSNIIADPEPKIVYILFGIFGGCTFSAFVIVVVFLIQVQPGTSVTKAVVKAAALSWFQILSKTDFKYLTPLMFYFAVAEEILSAEITKAYISCPIGIQNVGYVMMTYGASSCLTSFVYGRLAKYTRRYIMFTIMAIMQMTLFVILYHWVPSSKDTVYIYVYVSVWGVCEGIWKINNAAMIGEIFSEHIKSVFAVKEGFKSMAYTVTFVYSSFICVSEKLSIAMAVLAVAMTFYYFVEFRFIRRQKQMLHQKEMEEIVELKAAEDP